MKFSQVPLLFFIVTCCAIATLAENFEVPPLPENGPADQIAIVDESRSESGSATVEDVDQFGTANFFNPKHFDVRYPQHKLPVLIRGTSRGYDILIVVTDVFKNYTEVTRFWYKRGNGRFPRYYDIPATVETTVYRVAAYFGKNVTGADDLIRSHDGFITRHVGIVGSGRACNASVCANVSRQMSPRARISEWSGAVTHLNVFSPEKTKINQITGCATAAVTWPAVMKYARTSRGVAHFLFARQPGSPVVIIMRGDIVHSAADVMRAVRPGEQDMRAASCWATRLGTTAQGVATQEFFFNLRLATADECSVSRVLSVNRVYCSKNDLLLSRWFLSLQRVL